MLFRSKARGIHAAGTCRNRKGFPLQQLKAVQLSRRGQVAWLTHNSLTALRWKDKKDIFLLSSIHTQPEVPEWVEDPVTDDDSGERPPDVVLRRVRENGVWRSKRFYQPEIVKDYNSFMGGVDLCDQMTRVNKSKKQVRWYLRVFLKLLMLSIHNSYVLESFKIDHTQRGHRKRDLLSFKQDLVNQLVGNFPLRHRQCKRRKQISDNPARMQNVGLHLPYKGAGADHGKEHRCVVCKKKCELRPQLTREINPETGKPFLKPSRSVFKCGLCNVHLCIGQIDKPSCFTSYHTKEQYWLPFV